MNLLGKLLHTLEHYVRYFAAMIYGDQTMLIDSNLYQYMSKHNIIVFPEWGSKHIL